MLLHTFTACPADGPPARTTFFSHRQKHRLYPVYRRAVAPRHERQRGGLGARHTPRNRGIDHGDSPRRSMLMHVFGRAEIGRRGVHDDRFRSNQIENPVAIHQHMADFPAGREHREDEFGILHRIRVRGRRLHATGRRPIYLFRNDIVACDVVAHPYQVDRHRSAHVSKPDERDLRHVTSPHAAAWRKVLQCS